jgi:hypothetical protein
MRSRFLKGEGVTGTSSSYKVREWSLGKKSGNYPEVVAGNRWRRRSRRLRFRHAWDWQLI